MRTLIFASILAYGTLATAQSFTARARLVSQADIAERTLEKAQAEAVYVAKTGGLTLVWVVDSNEPPDFVFVVKDRDAGVGKSTLGQSLLGDRRTGAYSYIYFKHVSTAKQNTDLSPGDLLGDVIAHELGHLLGLHHAREGIMSAKWSSGQLALLARRGMHFSQAEALEMQSEIHARRMLQHDELDVVQLAGHERPLQ